MVFVSHPFIYFSISCSSPQPPIPKNISQISSQETGMWKLKIAEGGHDPYEYSTNNYVGRQIWEFDPEAGTPEDRAEVDQARLHFFNNRFKVKTNSDLLWRMQFLKEKKFEQKIATVRVEDGEEMTYEKATAAMRRAAHYYSALQASDGHWPAEQAGCLFFMPPLLMCLYITGHLNTIITAEHRREILRYIYCHQQEDGGWGLHIAGHSSMFGTVLNYIAMRILGEGPDGGEDNACARGRQWIRDRGGATSIPSWGKLWLSILGVVDWSCSHPMPPEFWLLPGFIPLHPDQMLCYCRVTYKAMSYLYGKRFVGPITPLVLHLRDELLPQPYDSIDWKSFRHVCAKEDLYYPRGVVQHLMWDTLYTCTEPLLTRWPLNALVRARALENLAKHVHYEDENTRYITIGCVEKPLFMLCCWAEDPNSDYVKKHVARVADYLWVGEDGMKMQSFGSQTWDASFSVQAMMATNLAASENEDDRIMMERSLERGHFFLKESQVKDELPGDYRSMYRHTNKGSWTFSDQDHGWAVSDCTAEALSCCLVLSTMPIEIVGKPMKAERLYDAVNVILYLQSKNGGLSGWEPAGTQKWMEILNPTEFLADLVVETEYVECTSSAIHGLVLFKKLYPGHRKKEIEHSIANAASYIESIQNPDGSWFGNWGICFTYGTWFAIRGLSAAGKSYNNCEAIRRGVGFLLRIQRENGGWGESYRSSPDKIYVPLEDNRSNLVQTSWALLGLIISGQGERDPKPIHLGVKLLINSQMENGDFPQEDVLGTFMKNCMLHYAAYNNIFPLWALAEYRNHVLLPSKNT